MMNLKNLKNLKPICDVSVSLASASSNGFVDVEFNSCKEREAKDFRLSVEEARFYCSNPYRLCFVVQIGNYDARQLAEQIAVDLEETGLKVRRLVPTPGADDLSPNMAVQSFVSFPQKTIEINGVKNVLDN
jgi:hypothetical protein